MDYVSTLTFHGTGPFKNVHDEKGCDLFGPEHRLGFGGYAFGPFLFVGGLVRLAFFAGMIVLGVVFYRKCCRVAGGDG